MAKSLIEHVLETERNLEQKKATRLTTEQDARRSAIAAEDRLRKRREERKTLAGTTAPVAQKTTAYERMDISALDREIEALEKELKKTELYTDMPWKSTADRLTELKGLREQARSAQYDAAGAKALADLDAGYLETLDKLLEGAPQDDGVQMQGIADNRSWEEIYAEDEAYLEGLRAELRAGGYDDKEIAQLLDYRQRQKNRENYEAEVAEAVEYAEDHEVGASIKSVGQNLTGGLGYVSLAAQNAHNKLTGNDRPLDYYTPEMLGTAKAQAARETVSKDMGKVGAFLYNTGMSMADSAAIMGMAALGIPPAAGSVLLGGTAATSAAMEAKKRGVSDDQALLTGLAAGTFEALFEKVSLDKVVSGKVVAGEMRDRVVQTLKNIGIQQGVEGSEEFFTSVANTMVDNIINGGMSELNTMKRELMESGYSEAEADKLVTEQWAKSLALDFIGGAISGGVFGGVSTGFQTMALDGAYGEMYGDRSAQLTAEAMEINGESKTAQKAAQRIAEGKKPTAAQVRTMAEAVEKNVREENEESLTYAVSAVATRLDSLGELGDTEKIAEAVVEMVRPSATANGRAAAQKVLESSTQGQRALRELRGTMKTVDDRLYAAEGKTINPNAKDKRAVTGVKFNAKTKKMDAIVKKEDGGTETVPLDTSSATMRQMRLAEAAEQYGESGSVMVAGIRDDQDTDTYMGRWNLAYEYGKGGVPKEKALASELVRYLRPEQAEMAYEEGAKVRAAEGQKKAAEQQAARQGDIKRGEGTVSMEGAVVDGVRYNAVSKAGLSKKQKAAIDVMRLFANATGVNVVFYESELNEQGMRTQANGMYRDGVIYLDIAAGVNGADMTDAAILRTAAHELTHFIQDFSQEEYDAIHDFMLGKLAESKGVSVERLIADKVNRESGLSPAEAVDELIADGCEMMLKNESWLQALQETEPGIAKKILNFLRRWLANLRRAFVGVEAQSAEAKAMLAHMDELQALWNRGLATAVDTYRRTNENTAEDGGVVRNAIREVNGKWFVQADRQVLTGEDPSAWGRQLENYINESIRGGNDVVFPTQDGHLLVLTERTAYKMKDRHISSVSKKVEQYLSDEDYARKSRAAAHLDELIKVARFDDYEPDRNGKHKNDIGEDGFNYFIAYFMDEDGKYYEISFSAALNADAETAYSIGEIRKRKAPASPGSSTKTGGAQKNGRKPSGGIIYTSGPNSQEVKSAVQLAYEKAIASKTKKSARAMDSEGGQLSAQQQEYFADSVVRDADGRLKVVYHGSTAVFTEFDLSFMGRHGSAEGQGIYFTDSKTMAEGYQNADGQLMEGYLLISKPLSNSKLTLTRAEVRKLLTALDPTGDDIVSNYDTSGMGYPSRAWYNRSMNAALDMLMDGNDTDTELMGEIANINGDTAPVLRAAREVLGYDGYIVEGKYEDATVYVAFESNQFKNRDNTTPTKSGDVRYSARQTKTAQFKEWFGDWQNDPESASKVVNANGTPKIVYHGTDGQFTIFEHDRIGSSTGVGMLGNGFYFTDKKNAAQNYGGNVMPAYLDIKNPYMATETDLYKLRAFDLKAMGYDGVILQRPSGTVYVAFENTQIKSATDNIGTFDRNNSDVRYSTRAMDSEYLSAVERGNLETAQRMVDAAAKAAGYDRRMFHETDAENIHVFDIARGDHGGTDYQTPYGIFTKTSDKNIGLGKKQMALFVKAHHTLRVENRDEVQKRIPGFVRYYDQIKAIDEKYSAIAEVLEDAEFDALMEWMDEHPDADMDEVYPNAYIAEGKPADIDSEKYLEAHQKYRQNKAEWEQAYNAVAIKAKAFIVAYLRKNNYDSMYFVVDGGSRGRQTDSLILLDENQVKSADPVTYDDNGQIIPISERFDETKTDIRYSARDAAQITDREILAHTLDSAAQTQAEKTLLERYRAHAEELRKLEGQITYYRNRLKAVENGTAKMSETEKTQARNRINSYARLADREETMLRSLAKKEALQAVLERERSYIEEQGGSVEELKARYEGSLEQKVAELWGQARTWERKYKEAIDNMPMTDKRSEREKMKKLREDIRKKGGRLIRMLETNTDKLHVPEELKEPLGAFLDTIAFRGKNSGGTPAEYAQRLNALAVAIGKKMATVKGRDGETAEGYLDLPQYFRERVEYHAEMAESLMRGAKPYEAVVSRLGLEELQDLDMILSVLSKSIKGINELHTNKHFATVEKAAEDTKRTLKSLGQYEAKGEKLEGYLSWKNILPEYAFRKFGEGGKSIFEALQDGWDKLAFNAAKVIRFTEETYTSKEAEAWNRELHEVELISEGEPVTVQMSAAQIMSLWALSRRKQALGHLLRGGIRLEDISFKGKTIHQDKQLHLEPEDIAKITKLLSSRQLEVAQKLQRFMETQGSAWGNEVSMERHGYNFFGEQNYFPIETDDRGRGVSSTEKGRENDLFRLLNISATKAVVKEANNSVMVRNIFDVYSNHMADMAKYNALALPILDAIKWFNFNTRTESTEGFIDDNSVHGAIEKAYGKTAKNYVTEFLKDLNGVKEGSERGAGLAKNMVSRYKRAQIAANLRVAFLQPTAIVRALAVMQPKYLISAAAEKTKLTEAVKEMQANSGIALWKSMGFFDTDVGRSMREQIRGTQSTYDKAMDKTMIAAEKADELTWAVLWKACKAEVAEKQKLEGDALIKATAKRFRDVIYSTQVVDSTMTRSGLMRSTNFFDKTMTSFMSEPTVTYNMVMGAVDEVRNDARRIGAKEAIKKHSRKLATAFTTYAVSALAVSLVETLADVWRDDDDETFWEKFRQAMFGQGGVKGFFGGNLVSNLNPLNLIPGASGVMSLLEGYAPSRMEYGGLTQALKSTQQLWEAFAVRTGIQEKPTEVTYYGNITGYGLFYNASKAVSYLSGAPLSNISREVIAVWNNLCGMAGWDNLKAATYENKKDAANRRIWNAMVENDAAAVEEEKEKLVQTAMDGGEPQRTAVSAANSRVRSIVRDNYWEGEAESGDVERYLQRYGGMTAEEATKQRKEWDCYIETGIKFGDIRTAYETGQIGEADVVRMRTKYGGDTAEEAYDKVLVYDWAIENPLYADIGETDAVGYYEHCERAGIGARLYYEAANETKGATKQEHVDYILSLGLSYSQSKALWLALKTKSWKDTGTPWE